MRRSHPVIIAISYLTMIFLYLPLLGVAVFSVNEARRGLVWKGFTFKWYLKLFENEGHIWSPSAFHNNWQLTIDFFRRHLNPSG